LPAPATTDDVVIVPESAAPAAARSAFDADPVDSLEALDAVDSIDTGLDDDLDDDPGVLLDAVPAEPDVSVPMAPVEAPGPAPLWAPETPAPVIAAAAAPAPAAARAPLDFTLITRALALLLAEVLAVVFGAWQLTFGDKLLAFVTKNDLPAGSRRLMLATAVGPGLLLVAVLSVFILLRRGPRPQRLYDIGVRLSPLLLLWLLPSLFVWKAWKTDDISFLLLALQHELHALRLLLGGELHLDRPRQRRGQLDALQQHGLDLEAARTQRMVHLLGDLPFDDRPLA